MIDPNQFLDRYNDGELSAEEFEQLQDDLVNDPYYANRFATAVLIDRFLQDKFNREAIISTMKLQDGSFIDAGDLSVLVDDYEHAQAYMVRADEDDDPAREVGEKQAAHDRVPDAFRWSKLSSVMSFSMAKAAHNSSARWAVAAAAMILLSLAVWQMIPAAPNSQQSPVAQAPSIAAVAYVARSSPDALYQGGAGLDAGLVEGEELRLTRGLLELRFDDGAIVILQSPAIIQATGPNSLDLLSGRLTAKVPESAHGFVVSCTFGTITDLGTEFGVAVGGRQGLQAEVFDGEIAFKNSRDGKPQSSTLLQADQAISVDLAGEIKHVEPGPLAYVQAEEFDAIVKADISAIHRWRAYRTDLLRDPDLLAFYSFDGEAVNGQAVSNEAPQWAEQFNPTLGDGRDHTAPIRSSDRFGRDNSAFSFDRQQMQALYVSDWHRAGPLDALTVSCWFKLEDDAGDWPLLVTHWHDNTANSIGDSFHLGAHKDNLRMGLQTHVSHTGDRSSKLGWDLKKELRSGSSISPDNGWIHVALTIQCGGGPIRLYKNGVEVDANGATYPPETLPSPKYPLVIGGKSTYREMSQADIPLFHVSGFFHGTIDDVAMIKRALSEDEIKDMYRAGVAESD